MRRYLILVVVLWLAYAVLTLLAPATHTVNQYRINLVQVNLVRVSILIPLLVIWLAAIYAVARFSYYSHLVRESAEGGAYRKLARGIFMLFLVLVVPSFINLIGNFSPGSAEVEKWVTIVRVYTSVVFYLLAFWYLWQGSRQLLQTLTPRPSVDRARRCAAFVVGGLAIAYAWAIFHNQFRTVSSDPLIKPTYFLPDWLIISTIFLPYLVIWLWGIWSIIKTHAFARHVPGVIYRQAFLSLARGLTAVVLLLIGLQFVSQASTVFGHASLRAILIIIYIIIFALAVGYIFLARGAKQLTSIEKV